MAPLPPPPTPLSSAAKKPFYRRWPFIALSGVLALGFLGNLGNSGASDSANAASTPGSSPQATSVSADEPVSAAADGATYGTHLAEFASKVSESATVAKAKESAAPATASAKENATPPAQAAAPATANPAETAVEPTPVPAEPVQQPVPSAATKSDVAADHRSALNKAETYSDMLHMSKAGIYNQLTSEFEQFTPEAAQYAVDNLQVDWNANALAKAKVYQDTMSMSPEAIRDQLTSEFEGFTAEEADYAITHLND